MKTTSINLTRRLLASAVLGSLLLFNHSVAIAQTQLPTRHIPPDIARLHLQPAGALSSTERLNLAVGLPLRNQSSLENMLRDINNPASPSYHHYLTPEEFTERFGPTAQDYQSTIAFLQSQGLTIIGTHPNRTLIDVNGSVNDIERAFHVTMNVYQHPTEARTFYAPDVEPSVDSTVPLLHVSGLDNYLVPRPVGLKFNSLDQLKAGTPMFGSGVDGLYIGSDFRAAYAPEVTLTGSGQAVGLFELDGFYPSDITSYEAEAVLPNVPLTTVLVDGFNGIPGTNGGNVEVALDIDMAISMAPGLDEVLVYEATNLDSSICADLLSRMATDDLAKQLSSSWGIGDDPNFDQSYLQFAAQGQSFFQASGDDGAYYPGIEESADDPNITLVGGTSLATTGNGSSAYLQTGTLLTNGQVLVTGGEAYYLADGGYSYAELYNPQANTWTATGLMHYERLFHTAALLTNGQVLVAGGIDGPCCSSLSSAELYNPATGVWTTTPNMTTNRADHTETLLTNGLVLVAGGLNSPYNGSALASAELYNPVTGTWTATGPMNQARFFHTATLLPNGEVLVAGGSSGTGGNFRGLNSSETYNPATGLWTTNDPMNVARYCHTATLLTNGEILVAGGIGGGYTAELFNPANGTWTETGSMSYSRNNHSATLLANGQVLVAGGFQGSLNNESVNCLSSTELYNPVTGMWTTNGPMITAHGAQAATLLPGGQILIAGGAFISPTYVGEFPLPDSELYDPATGTSTLTGSLSGGWASETTWSEFPYDAYAGGGGISTTYTIPTWQQGINMTTNGGSTTMRNIPDVALLANGIFLIADDGGSGSVGGTSAAAPMWAGFTALVNQQAVAAGRPTVGFINPAVYTIGKSVNYDLDFHDIITGNNTNSGSPNLYYACPGYDLCTGWGTPTGQPLINDLAPPPPTVSITSPAYGAVFLPPASITIDATATASGLNNSIAQVVFYLDGQAVGSPVTSPPYTVTASNVAIGTHQLTAEATDTGGSTAVSDPISVRVDAPPTVSITSPANGAVIPAPGDKANVTINATAADSDGTVSKVAFYNGGTLLGTVTTSPYTYTWQNVGSSFGMGYKLTAKATDNNGYTTTSSTVTINVDIPPIPSITSPTNGAVLTVSNVTLVASVTDPNGTISKVAFYQGTQLLGNGTQQPNYPPTFTWTYNYNWNNIPNGTYSITAIATDNLGLTNGTTPVSITINAP